MSLCLRRNHVCHSVRLRNYLSNKQVYVSGKAQPNGDEVEVPDYVGNFTKGFKHNKHAIVDQTTYYNFLDALGSENFHKLGQIKLGTSNGLKLVNPQAGYGYTLFGPDSYSVGLRTPPKFTSAETAGEMVELYEQALARDISFNEYDTSTALNETLEALNALKVFKGPKEHGKVTRQTLFRGILQGDLAGPYISQFLLLDFKIGDTFVAQRYSVPVAKSVNPNVEFMKIFETFLSVQNGLVTETEPPRDPTLRYIRNGRDLASFVHNDSPLHNYMHAAIILRLMGCPINPGIPYGDEIQNQNPFATLGMPDLVDIIGRAVTYALRAAWCYKWAINRRVRPEAFAAEVEKIRLGNGNPYCINPCLLNSTVLERLLSDPYGSGTYLLAQTYPEGSPVHPSYPAGHATVAGACITVIKAFFDGDFVIPQAKTPDSDGTSLIDIPDKLTVNGELNKLASNIALGRDFAGVHYRSDAYGIQLGEEVAIRMLRDLLNRYTEQNTYFVITKVNGKTIKITKST